MTLTLRDLKWLRLHLGGGNMPLADHRRLLDAIGAEVRKLEAEAATVVETLAGPVTQADIDWRAERHFGDRP